MTEPSNSSQKQPTSGENLSEEPGLVWEIDGAEAIPAEELPTAAPPESPPLLLGPPTDDSPTVISRLAARPTSGTEPVNNSLRGRRLAHFELITPVGVGGMAAVIKARDLQLDRTVALKILPPDMANDPENIQRFHQEARAAAKLDHENIARVFFCGEDQRLHFIAFEFVQGDNLRTILERRGRLPVSEALNYILQVATGLAHAAARGVVHRDIKPSNIIVTPTGRAKLVDMGLARSLAPQDDRGLTQSGVTLGTFDYISPEQALEPREADVRSDIYSLGCTFYHMLTGSPPVPEGTAAKKLHHHQHEAPIDPRELNPDIPDEVAAILSRMMAKNPRERYQRPEHLVQHLLRAAQKLDASGDRGEGVLFVDAPLPNAPARPLLLFAFAVAAVVALVFVVHQGTPPPRSPLPFPRALANAEEGPDPRSRDAVPPVKPGPASQPEPTRTEPENTSTPARFVFENTSTVNELRQFLDRLPEGSSVEIVLRKDLDLSESMPKNQELLGTVGPRGLMFGKRLRRVDFRGDERLTPRPTVWLVHDLESPASGVWTALYFQEVAEVNLRYLRVVTDARTSVPMTGVHLAGGSSHRLEDCQFLQVYPAAYKEDQRLCSVLAEAPSAASDNPTLMVDRCLFVGEEGKPREPSITPGATRDLVRLNRLGRGGHEALVRKNGVHLTVRQTAFGPHRSCLRLEGNNEGNPRDLELTHCSVILGEGTAVFHVGADVHGALETQSCLFSRAEPADTDTRTDSTRRAVLIRTENGPSSLRYLGRDNRYHQLDAYWLSLTSGATASTQKEFEAWLAEGKGTDFSSQTLKANPWKEATPLDSLRRLEFAAAFRVQPQAADLRQPGQENRKLIGAEWCDGESYVKNLPRETLPRVDNQRREKLVDPLVRESGNGVYRTLAGALEEAQPDDLIVLKANGRLPVKPITLEKGAVRIRSAEGYRPILTLDTTDRDTALFRIYDARVTFEKIEFRLEPAQRGFEVQSIAAIAGDGRCAFEDCVLTLGDPLGANLAAVVLSDPGMVMRKTPRSATGPEIAFLRCFVRGNGDLLWCRASRPFVLEARHTLAALDRSFVSVDASKTEEVDSAGQGTLTLENVTVAVREHVLNLRPLNKELKALTPLSCKATGCLFASLNTGKALVQIAGGEASPTSLANKLRWRDGSNNAYHFPGVLLEQQPVGVAMMRPKPYDRDRWKEFTGEADGLFVEALRLEIMSELSQTRADTFAPPELTSYGPSEPLPQPSLADFPEGK